MIGRHVPQEELSAYVDGEARRPDDIARHLQQCAECARRHMELAKLSANVHALTPPAVSPALLTRVIAHAREITPARRARRPYLAFAGVATLALVLVMGAWFAWHGGRSMAPSTTVATAVLPTEFDEGAAAQEIEWRLANGGEISLDEMYVLWSATEYTDSENGVLSVEDNEHILTPLIDELESDQDVTSLVASLSDAEAATLRVLLSQYANEG